MIDEQTEGLIQHLGINSVIPKSFPFISRVGKFFSRRFQTMQEPNEQLELHNLIIINSAATHLGGQSSGQGSSCLFLTISITSWLEKP